MNTAARGYVLRFLLLLSLFGVPTLHSHAQTAREVAQKAFPSVVLLVMEDTKGQPLSMGSGFFVREDIIATNLHVIEGAGGGYARLVGKKAKMDILGVVGVHPTRDLALLKVSSKATPLPLGSDSKTEIGDTVYAVGNPQGLEGTFSQGILSGIREVGGDRLLQVTAPISPGSSGGPILNAAGQVVGVAVATFRGGQNLNFAIPSTYVSTLLTEMKPVESLASRTPTKNSVSILDLMGTPSQEGVVALNFKWTDESGYPSYYLFTMRNKLREPVKKILYVVIFYGHDGEPVHSELATYSPLILGSLAKTVKTGGGYTDQVAPHPGHHIRELTSRVEIRVLGFEMAEDEEDGDAFCILRQCRTSHYRTMKRKASGIRFVPNGPLPPTITAASGFRNTASF
jgi:hypothetical protein